MRRNITRDMSFQVDTGDSVESNGRSMDGYAAVFNDPTQIRSPYEGNFTERISPGAFKKTLEGNRLPKMQWNHGRDARVGATPIGAYHEVSEDGKGLRVKGELFDNPVVEPVRQAIAAGAVDGMSFTMQVIRDEWQDGDGNPVTGRDLQRKLFDGQSDLHRNIKEVKLLEAGPVLFPAYSGTSVGVRSAEDDETVDRAAIVAEYMRSGGMPITDLDKEDVPPVQNNDKTVADPDNGNDGQDLTKDLDTPVHADPGYQSDKQPRFPLDTAENVQSAVAQINDPEVASAYTSAQLTTVKANISNAANSFGVNEMKSDGTPVEERDTKDPKKPYGDVDYADPGYQKDGKKRYPLDTVEHVRAALSYIGQDKNASAYTSDQLTKVKSKIAAAAKKLGIDVSESKSDSTEAVQRDTSAAEKKTDSAAQRTLSEQDKTPPEKRTKVMTLAELRERLAVISVRQDELATEFRDVEMPDETDVEFEALKAERAKIETSIAKIETRLNEFKDSAVAETKRTVGGSDAPAYIKTRGEEIYDLAAIRRDSSSDEDLRNRLRDNAMRAIDKAKFGGGRAVKREDAQAQIEEFLHGRDDERGSLARRMLLSGSETYERAWSKAVAAGNTNMLSPEEARSMQLGVAADGGYAVPFQLDPTIMWTSPGVINPLRDLARVEQIVGKQWQGVTSSGTTVARSAEAAEATDNSFTLAQPVVNTERVAGFIPFSYEIAESWGQVRTEITAALVDAKGREEATSFVSGNGTAPNAGGLIGSLSGNPNIAGATAEVFNAASVYSLEVLLDPRWRANANFLAHRGIYNLIRQFDTAGGAQLWERIGAGLPPELLGYGAYESSVSGAGAFAASNVGAGGQVALLFGDFQQFLIVDRIGMSVELIPQVFGSARQMPTGQRGIYAVWMNNSAVLIPAAFATYTLTT